MAEENKRGRGRPKGTPGGGKFGCKTKVVRVPETVADNIADILTTFDAVKELVDHWEDIIENATEKSKHSKPPARYENAVKLLHELRALIGE